MAYTGQEFDATGASVKINNVEFNGGGTTEVSFKVMSEEKELLCFGNYPDPKTTLTRKWIEGSVNAYASALTNLPDVGTAQVPLSIAASGMHLTANAWIREPEFKLGTDGAATVSFNFKTGSSYTLTV